MQIPKERQLDSTAEFIRDPYRFISERCRRHGTDLFEARLYLRPTICMSGRDAAEAFYAPNRIIRHGAPPQRIQKTLFGVGGVQGLDGRAHRHRKELFLSLMSPQQIQRLGELTRESWTRQLEQWSSGRPLTLYSEAQRLLTRAACHWCGVTLDEAEVGRRTRQLTAMFDAAGAVGPRHWWSRRARKAVNRWLESVVGEIRARGGDRGRQQENAAAAIAWHRDQDGKLLSQHVAAVELANVLRPTVAIAVYVTFLAHALERHPACRAKLRESGPDDIAHFVQEVRRYYPFFPGVIGIVGDGFEWNGYPFPKGRRVLLDLYGTNRDPRVWDAPDEFRPERFASWNGDPFSFIPQGGGDHAANHRCPGEWITIELMKVATDFLVNHMRYTVPEQDLRIDYSRLPALPRSQMVLCDVRAVT